MIVTIDGPTASGKSTVARLLAAELGYLYLASGLLYRGLAYGLLKEHLFDVTNPKEPNASDVDAILMHCIYRVDHGQESLHYKDEDITYSLKEPLYDQASSILSMFVVVRKAIDEWQRRFAVDHDIVVEGRDTGAVVFPYADYKFFLTASLEVRAQRWLGMQYKKYGKVYSLGYAKSFISARDERDRINTVVALGAIKVDNTTMNTLETVSFIKKYFNGHYNNEQLS